MYKYTEKSQLYDKNLYKNLSKNIKHICCVNNNIMLLMNIFHEIHMFSSKYLLLSLNIMTLHL